MEPKRPRSREKNVTSGGHGIYRRGSGLGSGPVGSSNGYSGQKPRTSGKRAAIGTGISLPTLLFIGFLVFSFFKDGGSSPDYTQNYLPDNNYSDDYISDNNGTLDTSITAGSRPKYTQLLGNRQDIVTIMVYICGTDLESRNGMASSDIQEMADASFGDNVNLILYTGGCKEWKINGISNKKNQIYQIKDGKINRLEENYGSDSMTDPDTLTSFIRYCNQNFPANRNQLILWDHGGGSVSGFGYDEKNSGSGSMDLAEIDSALSNAGVKFDFVGFDACLMATAETALMLNKHADYMIASEETEPGIGWYYTDWLTALGRNTSVSTIETGKKIIDDFVSTCAKRCRGQKTTLSIVDLAEFSNTVPDRLNSFALSVSNMMSNQEYKAVSDARYLTREFAVSSKIDQVDLAHLALNMNNPEGEELSNAIRKAVKYNRTSSNITNAYGISIYFPYRRTSNVDTACNTYNRIGMDSEYSKCIRQFASFETSGQIASGGTSSPLSSLLGILDTSVGSGSTDMIGQLIDGFLSGSSDRIIEGLDSSNTGYMNETAMSAGETAEYISMNYFDASRLVWEKNSKGQYVMELPESQWELVHNLDKNLFYDETQLLDSVNMTLKRAKEISNNRIQFFSPEDLKEKIAALALLEELKQSVENNFEGFEVHYQPQLKAGTYEIYGIEALLRYNSPKLGRVFPDKFIPLLEHSHLIKEVGMWVLAEALTQCKKWRENIPNLKVSVNFSAIQFEDTFLAEKIINTIRKVDIDSSALTVEITESMDLHGCQQIIDTIKTLKTFDINFAIDDFGTGYSNLGYLKQLNIDEIKIDRVFVSGIENDTYNHKLISNVIEFAKSNAIRTCCEGVESTKELVTLELLLPDIIQGYLFDKPNTAEIIEKTYIDKTSKEYSQRVEFINQLYDFKEKMGIIHFNSSDILRENELGLWKMRINLDINHFEIHIDDTMEKSLGIDVKYTPKECYDYLTSKIHPDYYSYVIEGIRKMIYSNKSVQLEFPWLHAKLGDVMIRMSGKRVKDSDNMIVLEGYHKIITNVEGI